jgi:anti-sigma regulatory factor (Ser/Thr protein kinase)
VRATVEQATLGATSELSLPALASELGRARAYARAATVAFGFDEERCEDVVCAFNEAVTNAIRHGRPDVHGRIHLSVRDDGERLTLAVCDHGTFAVPPEGTAPRSEGGRGFPLMTALMDTVELCVEAAGTTVRLSKARA